MELCFTTGNPNKLKEVSDLLGSEFTLKSLKDIGCTEELKEDQSTLEGNAEQKAAYVHEQYGIEVFSDDTGLEVEALSGEPGVYSARYAGPQKNDADNIALLLEKLAEEDNRKAQFRTVICLIIKDTKYFFEGIVKGNISTAPKGSEGFGYDPVFIPEGETRSFAEMSLAEKNSISHRARAFKKLVDFLGTNFT